MAKKRVISRIKLAFVQLNASKITDAQLDQQLISAVQGYSRETKDWCQTCGPQVESDFAYTPACCTKCYTSVSKKRAPRKPVPNREDGSVVRYGKKVWKRKQCEECGLKQAIYGLASEGKKRWCSGCGKPKGAYDMVNAKCEDCGVKSATYCLESEGRKRWCATCGKKNNGVPAGLKRCEDCQGGYARWCLPGESVRWCTPCAKSGAPRHVFCSALARRPRCRQPIHTGRQMKMHRWCSRWCWLGTVFVTDICAAQGATLE